MRAELANLSQCALPFLSRAAVNLSWCDSSYGITYRSVISNIGISSPKAAS